VFYIAVPLNGHPLYFSKKSMNQKLKAGNAGKMVEDNLKLLGKRIRSLRIARGYTSHELFAYTHGINRTQYGRYERGKDLTFHRY
jgi:DNA-binding XRE family transcriptional regulator